MKPVVTDLPFKVNNNTIVVIKNLPVFQCQGCPEYLLDDLVMQQVEEIMAKVDIVEELEVINYAA